MSKSIKTYGIEELSCIDLDCFPVDNLGWAVAERFPTAEYLEVKAHCDGTSEDDADDPVTALGEWQEDENYADYIDMAAFLGAPIRFYILLDGDTESDCVKILLSAKSQADIDYIVSIVEETHCPAEVKIISG